MYFYTLYQNQEPNLILVNQQGVRFQLQLNKTDL